jgi:Fe-Mn family superoxide dismutase
MTFALPPLPYAEDALEPHISAKTMHFHYHKHHADYVDKVNELVRGSAFEGRSLEEIIRLTANGGAAGDKARQEIFNNAAQVWNHTFFWRSMRPKGGGAPEGAFARRMQDAFGPPEKFKEKFLAAAKSQFGTGWAWLVADKAGELAVVKTEDAVNPLVANQTPLICCDVWEHAYYLDYQNRRPDFVKAFLEHLVDWDMAARRLSEAKV